MYFMRKLISREEYVSEKKNSKGLDQISTLTLHILKTPDIGLLQVNFGCTCSFGFVSTSRLELKQMTWEVFKRKISLVAE